ncbi:MAG: acylphosphatase [Fibrobacterota bacterium]
MKRYIFRVTGRVQGVGFRFSAQHTARTLDLAGFIKNDPTGSVSGEAEGAPDHVDAFLNWLRRGPSTARVDDLDWHETAPRGTAARYPFEIDS